jgi:beta-aspartyl-peptidase (threonine type)
MKPKIIAHGGARQFGQDELLRQKAVTDACKKAHKVLLKRGAVEAVETAIKAMESSEHLNAGMGSYLQIDGTVRMDAAIMKSDLSAGAVVAIEGVQHPISVARRVMETTQHVMLSGRLATEFAYCEGFPRFDPRTRSRVELWLDIMDELRTKTSYEQIFHVDRYLETGRHQLGTVGCVAIDASGAIAAGTSTGGLKRNVPGRVGDSAIIGAGIYCSEHGGVSCTGIGEKILVLSLAKEVVNYLRYEQGVTASEASGHGVDELDSIKAEGGVICIDRDGNMGFAHNTEVMTMHYIE